MLLVQYQYAKTRLTANPIISTSLITCFHTFEVALIHIHTVYVCICDIIACLNFSLVLNHQLESSFCSCIFQSLHENNKEKTS